MRKKGFNSIGYWICWITSVIALSGMVALEFSWGKAVAILVYLILICPGVIPRDYPPSEEIKENDER